ncbi:MAG: hypothetical protein HYY01_12475 [Chloroflexi bacterium]|nr:hypothetical protein [Chloroflexota bacterium]
MNLADYFKAKPDRAIDAFVEELLASDMPRRMNMQPVVKTATERLVDSILGDTEVGQIQVTT